MLSALSLLNSGGQGLVKINSDYAQFLRSQRTMRPRTTDGIGNLKQELGGVERTFFACALNTVTSSRKRQFRFAAGICNLPDGVSATRYMS